MIDWFGVHRGDVFALSGLHTAVPGAGGDRSEERLSAEGFCPDAYHHLPAQLERKTVLSGDLRVFTRSPASCVRLVGAGKSEQTLFITREQFSTLVDMAEQSAALSESNRGRIRRVIRFADTTVAEAMVPIAQVISHWTATRSAGRTCAQPSIWCASTASIGCPYSKTIRPTSPASSH